MCATMKLIGCFLAIFAISVGAYDEVDKFHQAVTDLMTTPFPETTSEAPGDMFGNIDGQSSMLADACRRQGGAEAALKAQEATLALKLCALKVVRKNPERPGPMAGTLQTMCIRLDNYKTCVAEFVNQLHSCLAEDEQFAIPMLQNITETTIDFMCDNNARNTLQFLSEKGPECIRERQTALGICVNTLYMDALSGSLSSESTGVNGIANPPSSKQTRFEDCKTINKFRKCTVKELTTCSSRIPVNFIEKIYNLVSVFASCDKYTPCDLDPECSSQSLLVRSLIKKYQID